MNIGKLSIETRPQMGIGKVTSVSWCLKDGYWRWTIWLLKNRSAELGFGPSMDAGKRYSVGGHFAAWLSFPFVVTALFMTQPKPI